ncbi:MAG: prephenate dehydrogenase [Mycobacterium leprae]
MIGSVLVVGTGLVGASVGLALRRAGVRVWLDDAAPAPLGLAVELGVGERWTGERVDVAVLAVPPDAVAPALVALQARGVARTYTDVASTKAGVLRDAVIGGADLRRFVGGHPLAGRERSGPAAARADLFAERPWVLVAPPVAEPGALADVRALAEACRARVVEMDAGAHDAAVALVSHLPQLVASLLAGRLIAAPDEALGLAGQGLRDTTRIAASDTELWVGIVAGNAAAIRDELRAYADALHALTAAVGRLAAGGDGVGEALEQVRATLARGRAGRARLPGKRGTPAPSSGVVPVVVSDRSGELARLLGDVARAGVNLDDLVLEHARGQPLGIAELHVPATAADDLAARLRAAGWPVRS